MKEISLKREINWLLEEKYKGKLTKSAERDIERLKKREPVDYLIGFTEFLGCKIDLSQRPLIPRPETEYLVEKAIGDIKKSQKKKIYCLDIFSGSGCIGTAILKNIVNTMVDFAEIDKRFLKQIRINLKLNKINPKRYQIIQSDIFQKIKKQYDYILANPPYISHQKINKVQKSVLEYEPPKALLAGEDGLFYIKRFLKEAKPYLKEKGKIYLEFDSFQKEKIRKILKDFQYSDYQFQKDQYGKWRYLVLKKND